MCIRDRIDGIINNGPKEDKTAEVKAPERGEKSSIMDRLKSATVSYTHLFSSAQNKYEMEV